jgi:DNA processing protein
MSASDYYLLINHVFHDQPRRMVDILNRFPTKDALQKNANTYAQETQLSERQKKLLTDALSCFSAEETRAKLTQRGLTVITWDSDDYPELLREIPDPPPVLYVQGRINLLSREFFAIVGSRDMTAYGQEVTSRLAQDIAPYFIIVSGLAAGVDTVAHETAVRLGYPTLAVVATGLDRVYPTENKGLAEKIAENGLIISEYPLGTPAVGYRFPQRNRIISGLSRGMLICEAKQQSGAMVTARHAMEQNRDVFAVPGPIFSRQSDGCHSLIQDGAKLVRGIEDILGEYSFLPFPKTKRIPMTSVERIPLKPDLDGSEADIWALLGETPIQLEELLEKSILPVSQILTILSHFEAQKWITILPGQYYTRHHGGH